MSTSLQVGMTHEITIDTTPEHNAQTVHQNLPEVFGTPSLVCFMERASAELVDMHLEPGQQSVGGAMDLQHTAATPLGMQVRVKTEATAIEGKKLTFKLEAWDEQEKIGQATHIRFIINPEKFNAGVAKKAVH